VARATPLLVLLFAVTAGIYLLSGKTFFGYDGEITYRMSESLVLRHTAVITDPVYHVSQPYSPYGIGLSLLLVPLVFAGWIVLHDPRALVTLFEPAVVAGTCVALAVLLVDLGSTWRRALWLALVFAFATLAWHYSGLLVAEPAIGLSTVLAVLWLHRFSLLPRGRLLWLAGAALGVAVLMRWDALLLAAIPCGVYAGWAILRTRPSWRDRLGDTVAFGVPIAAAVAVNLWWDVFRWGSAFGGPQGANGYGFNTPLVKGVFGLLLSPGVGLLVYVPVLVLAIVGAPAFFQRWKAEALLIGGLLVVRLLLYGRWWAWEGGTTWGPRYLLPVIALLVVPIAFIPARRGLGILAWTFAGLSAGIELLGQAVPFGMYYGPVASGLVRAYHLVAVPDGTPLPGAASQTVNNIIDFNWIYAPIPMQIEFVLRGIVDPMWVKLAPLLPVVLALVVAGIVRMGRIASRMDNPLKEKGRPAGRPLRRSSSG
jgi:hypothetical protein